MTATITRPCWNCGNQHHSDTMPALCSPACTEQWQKQYAILPLDAPVPTAAEIRAEHGNRALQAQAPSLVLSLYNADQLGYLAASDEWVNGEGWPLIEPLQLAATALALDGKLPAFAEWFPAPTEDDRDLPDGALSAATVPEPPAARPRPKPRPPWWRRFRRA